MKVNKYDLIMIKANLKSIINITNDEGVKALSKITIRQIERRLQNVIK